MVSSDIEQVRHLIFGEQLREFHEEFAKLENKLNELKTNFTEMTASINEMIQKVENKNSENLSQLKETIHKSGLDLLGTVDDRLSIIEEKIEHLRREKTDREEVSSYLADVARKLKGNKHDVTKEETVENG